MKQSEDETTKVAATGTAGVVFFGSVSFGRKTFHRQTSGRSTNVSSTDIWLTVVTWLPVVTSSFGRQTIGRPVD